MIDHVVSEYRHRQEWRAFQYYVTDVLQKIANDQGVGITQDIHYKSVGISFREILNPKKKDNRPAEEIVIDIISNAGLTLGE